ncbi:spermidine/putrescine ABC transporter permease [Spiroplasma chinense]|uniref:Spermidine/putrescine ABC transporter permease n=1 Tax=Spiroplasma chinense TaxID=216932 RepID=A0A5B9Y3S9_9MOLU|nr:spermidine/putrescine ABC transporter permease/substrate-binding protein [Spiroplasma chinense]QEH61413.1 spermidine/putrescine ABC transporter permease [Spiroplasma chinense]
MKRFFKASYFAIILLLIYVPIAVMIIFSFNSGSNLNRFEGFSLKWYSSFLANSPFVKSIIVSLFVAMMSTIISIIIGMLAVIGLAKSRRKVRDKWVRIANIPLVNADVITAVGLMLIFIFSGMKFGIVSLLAAHVSFNVPYVIVTVLPFMLRIDKNLLDASKDLGSTPTKTFFKVVLPILLPSIITGAAICFAMSFDDFIISYFTGGDQTNVSTFIYTAKRMQPYINAFGTILVAAIIFIILVWNAIEIGDQKSTLNKELLKKGDYKIKLRTALENKIAVWQACIDTELKTRRSKNLFKWMKYNTLQLQIKRLNSKNNNSKISKLEWKKALLTDEIKEEKRFKTIHAKLVEKKAQIELKISKLDNEKKIKKLESVVYKLDKKIDKYQGELDWIANRDEIAKEKASHVLDQINTLRVEMDALDQNDKKQLNWYKKKIAVLETKRSELIEGKVNLKLRMTIEKLEVLKTKNEEISRVKYEELQKQKALVLKQVSIVESIDKKIAKLEANKENIENFNEQYDILQAERKEKMELVKDAYYGKIEAAKAKLNDIQEETTKKMKKHFPDVLAEDYVAPKGRWIAKKWKPITMGTILVSSFSLITTAYIMNNIYDLVVGNWGSYIDMDVITNFEKEYGVKVNYQQYDSNESLYNKNYTFNYDLMVPSDYMVQKMGNEGLLQPIKWECLPTVDSSSWYNGPSSCDLDINNDPEYEANTINEALVNEVMADIKITDEEGDKTAIDYSIPYIWGDVRFVFNTTNSSLMTWLIDKGVVKTSDDPIHDDTNGYIVDEASLSWSLLWEAANKGYNLALNEDPKNVFMYAFEKLYGNVKPEDSSEVNGLSKKQQVDAAAAEVKTLLAPKNVGIYGDQLIDKVAIGDYDVAVMYNGDAIWALSEDYEPEGDEDEDAPAVEEEPTVPGEEEEWSLKGLTGVPEANVETEGFEDKIQNTNIWTDNMVISKKNRNLRLTYDFINYLLKEDNQYLIVDETGSTSPLENIIEGVMEPDEDTGEYYFGSPTITSWFMPTDIGTSFTFDEVIDNYLVDEFNKIVATKV